MARRHLVTGAAGFLGSHLCESLTARGDEVVGIDNLITGHLRNLEGLDGCERFDFVEADVAEPLPALGSFDSILHFASPASPPRYVAHPLETLRAGSVGTDHLLELATRGAARFLLASTSEVYVIRPSTRRSRPTGATSTRTACAACTTRPSASRRR